MSERSMAAAGDLVSKPWPRVALPMWDADRPHPDEPRRSASKGEAPAPDAAGAPSARLAIAQWIACSLLIAIPFLAVRFPPITDLPQQTAQIRLLEEALRDPTGPYRIQWFTPYSFQYLLLAAGWLVAGPGAAGRAGMLAVGLLWVAAVHLVAWRRRRPLASAALASILFFNHTTYWGLYSFVLGLPAFVLWLLLTSGPRRDRARWTDAALAFAAAVLLYMVHVLWLAAATLWLVVSSVVFRIPRRALLARAAGLAPVLVATTLWYPRLSAAGFTSSTVWGTTPIGRLSLAWLVGAMFGGLRGPVEFAIAAVLALWLVLAILQRRGSTPKPDADRGLWLAAAMFLALAFILPDKYTNTNQFASRWVPPAAALLLLGCPRLRWGSAATSAAALCIVAVMCLGTASAWRQFERFEMSGMSESLAALPERPRVLGLDYVKRSPVVAGRPFLQAFAYAQATRGGRLNFSFAEFAPSLVVFRTTDPLPWTGGLEWYPERLQSSDLSHFDHALVNTDEAGHQRFSVLPGVRSVTGQGRWRLYRIEGPHPE